MHILKRNGERWLCNRLGMMILVAARMKTRIRRRRRRARNRGGGEFEGKFQRERGGDSETVEKIRERGVENVDEERADGDCE